MPASERDYLRTLSGPALRARVCSLHAAGWPLAAIGEALDPPRPRSTVHSWVSSPPSASAADSSIAAAENSAPPLPSLSAASAASAAAASSASTIAAAENSPSPSRRPRSQPYTPGSGALTADERASIAALAPIARRYRANSNPHGSIAVSNAELTRICRDAHARGVSIPELASAAGVTYKAMERRVKEKK